MTVISDVYFDVEKIFSRKKVKRKVPMPNLELVILLKFKFKNIKKYKILNLN